MIEVEEDENAEKKIEIRMDHENMIAIATLNQKSPE
jgi:hypothetical protein